jgi:hypothetical protein
MGQPPSSADPRRPRQLRPSFGKPLEDVASGDCIFGVGLRLTTDVICRCVLGQVVGCRGAGFGEGVHFGVRRASLHMNYFKHSLPGPTVSRNLP